MGQRRNEMKHSLKTISIIIVLLMTAISIAAIIFFGICTVRDYRYLTNPSEVNDFGFLGYILSWPFLLITMAFRIISTVMLIIEDVLLILHFVKASKEDTFKRYWEFSSVGLFAEIINVVMFMFFIVGDRDIIENPFSIGIYIGMGMFFFTIGCTIYDMVVSRREMKFETIQYN
jgi:hypothetical protein